ncbi:hypothetical protein N7450_007726 [Penicillium hetheringtonii]|uniref:Methyltransferase domain-containing protein n=1 Tax=Penicillium hetheringtonii TaxID=911720 RepID=A0AAD6DF14_9EURO|nr:hypothetical protein N7450_007726 [Penicillium hetheringtonii]
MPRINPATLIKAYSESPLLPLLLKECRTLESARNELRWLREHVLRPVPHQHQHQHQHHHNPTTWKTRLISLCRKRSRGYPLQYILGDQPFGDLEILCRPGVLIPRPDTEAYVIKASKIIAQITSTEQNDSTETRKSRSTPLRILDLCTGTGCITLLLHALLAPQFDNLRIMGIDISPKALSLARSNLNHNLQQGLLSPRASTEIQFHRADVLAPPSTPPSTFTSVSEFDTSPPVETILQEYFNHPSETDKVDPLTQKKVQCDLLISNPPYISTRDFRNGTTSRSVRLFEPKTALVPPSLLPNPTNHTAQDTDTSRDRPEDIFYRSILELGYKLKTKVIVLECGDIQQADRVVDMHRSMTNDEEFSVQIWPFTKEDMSYYGFHSGEGSRCVIIQRGCTS